LKPINIVVISVLLIMTVSLLTLGPKRVQAVRGAFLQAISPFLKTGATVQNKVTNVTTKLKSLDQLERDNQRLLIENENLKAINLTLRNLEEDNNGLRRALNYRERAVYKLVPARIVTREAGTWLNSFTIDCGTNKGLKPDMPVVTDEGIVGKTTVVSASIAEVILISDERLQIAASVEGSREQGVVQGAPVTEVISPLLALNFLSKEAQFSVGQKVYSSGLGGVFPSGLLIGTVKSTRQRDLDTQALLMPAVDLSEIEDVFVVTGG